MTPRGPRVHARHPRQHHGGNTGTPMAQARELRARVSVLSPEWDLRHRAHGWTLSAPTSSLAGSGARGRAGMGAGMD